MASVEVDRFAVSLAGLLEEAFAPIEEGMPRVVRKSCQKGAKEARKLARARFKGTGRYAKGFRYKVKGGGPKVSGEIGNASLPGLVHLLEKGHATIGGGRVAGRPHFSDAADAAEDELVRGVEELVERSLS